MNILLYIYYISCCFRITSEKQKDDAEKENNNKNFNDGDFHAKNEEKIS